MAVICWERLLLFLVLIPTTESVGPWCYDCDMVSKPGSCGEIIRCQQDELCYAASVMNGTTVDYRAGCKQQALCPNTSPHSGARGVSSTPCDECCDGHHCNNKLCGGLPVPLGGPRLCMECEAVQSVGQCDAVVECGQDQDCAIWKKFRFGFTFYDLGCIEKKECPEHIKGVDKLSHGGFLCCDDDLCNSDLNSTTPTTTVPTTAAASAVTTTNAVTTAPDPLSCRQCDQLGDPSQCSTIVQCGPDQFCVIETLFKFGLRLYKQDCYEKSNCVGHMNGVNKMTDGGLLCCDQNLCNSNLNMTAPAVTSSVTSATTTATTPGTTVTSSTTTLASPATTVTTSATTVISTSNPTPTISATPTSTSPIGSTSNTLQSAPVISNINQTLTVIKKEHEVDLHCNVSGDPTPSVTWEYDKTKISNAFPNGPVLRIIDVEEKNGGDCEIPTCVAVPA